MFGLSELSHLRHLSVYYFLAITVIAAVACATLFYLGKRLDFKKPKTQGDNLPDGGVLDGTENQKPDASVETSDPQIEIKFCDLRGKTVSKDRACFDLINRSKKSPANLACIDDFSIGGYRVAFRCYPPPISPGGNHDSIVPFYINDPTGKLSELDIFNVFYEAWNAIKNRKLYEFSIPIKATYQDDYRNLFEVRCELVFYPGEHLSGPFNGRDVIEIKNQRIRKVAIAVNHVNWEN